MNEWSEPSDVVDPLPGMNTSYRSRVMLYHDVCEEFVIVVESHSLLDRY